MGGRDPRRSVTHVGLTPLSPSVAFPFLFPPLFDSQSHDLKNATQQNVFLSVLTSVALSGFKTTFPRMQLGCQLLEFLFKYCTSSVYRCQNLKMLHLKNIDYITQYAT